MWVCVFVKVRACKFVFVYGCVCVLARMNCKCVHAYLHLHRSRLPSQTRNVQRPQLKLPKTEEGSQCSTDREEVNIDSFYRKVRALTAVAGPFGVSRGRGKRRRGEGESRGEVVEGKSEENWQNVGC